MRILFLDLDTLRPDHLGCYGYHRNTSPNIDELAKEATRFDEYYCSDAPCLPSRTALMSGRFGIHTGVVGHGGTAADMRIMGKDRGFTDIVGEESLPSMIRDAGYKTVSISPFAERHAAWSFYAGFSEIHNTGKRGMESAEEITPTVLDWIDKNASDDNWFLHINYWDAHTPYRAPEDFGNPFKDSPLVDWINDGILSGHRKMVGPHKAREISMYDNTPKPQYPRYPSELENMEDVRRMMDGYDCGIRYMDGHLGQIFKKLKEMGIYDDTAIIITADHGENMGELGIYGEHATADKHTCNIPMIINWPGLKGGHVDKGLHYNLDMAPTLADMLGKEKCKSWDGQSFASVLKDGKSADRDYLVISQCAHVCQRSVRFENWLYVRTYNDGYHLFPKEMLFDFEKVPYEQNEISKDYPNVCQRAVYLLNDWHDDMMMSMPHDIDPLWTVMKEGGPMHARGKLKDYCKYLEKTQRQWAIPILKEKHPKEFLV